MDMTIVSANNSLVHTGEKGTSATLTLTASESLAKQTVINNVVILVVDTSGSMGDPSTNPNETKLTEAKREAGRFINSLPENFRLAVISGDSDANVIVGPNQPRSEAITAIRRLSASGGTNIDSWVDKTVAVIRTLEPECLVQAVFLTDGQQFEPRIPNLDRSIAAAKGLFDCYAIGFGQGINYDTLNKLATLNGAMYSATDGDLGAVFQEIQQSASTKVAKFNLVLQHEDWISIETVDEFFPQALSRTFQKPQEPNTDGQWTTIIDLGQFGAGESKEYLITVSLANVPAGDGDGYLLFTAFVANGSIPVSDSVDVEFAWSADKGETARLRDAGVTKVIADVTTRKLIRAGLDIAGEDPGEATKRLQEGYDAAVASGNEETKRLIVDMGYDPDTKQLKTLTQPEIEQAKTLTTKRLR
jgi:hypothetical protein